MSKILMFLLVFSFVGAIGAAVPADAVLSDFPRLADETDDAPRFRRAISAAAHLCAVAEMDFILTWDGHADYHRLRRLSADGSAVKN